MIAALVLALALPAGAQVPAVPPAVEAGPTAQELVEATVLALDQGFSSDQTLQPDAARVRELAAALGRIRSGFPDVAGIRDTRPPVQELLVGLAPALANKAKQLSGVNPGDEIDLAGLGALTLAAAVAKTGGHPIAGRSIQDMGILIVRYDAPIDLRKAAAAMKVAPGVRYAEPNARFHAGGAKPVSVELYGSGWRFVFHRGWGDCMAGCINNEYWFFSDDGTRAKQEGYYRRDENGETGSIPWKLSN